MTNCKWSSKQQHFSNMTNLTKIWSNLTKKKKRKRKKGREKDWLTDVWTDGWTEGITCPVFYSPQPLCEAFQMTKPTGLGFLWSTDLSPRINTLAWFLWMVFFRNGWKEIPNDIKDVSVFKWALEHTYAFFDTVDGRRGDTHKRWHRQMSQLVFCANKNVSFGRKCSANKKEVLKFRLV